MELETIIKAWQGKRILVIGDLMVDQYLWGDSNRISPEAPVPVIDVASRELRPGGAANAALNIQALGGEALICGSVGMDEKGENLKHILAQQGFDNQHLIQSPHRRTTVKTRVMARGQQLLRIDEEDRFPLNQEEERLFLHAIDQINEVDGILISDYDKGLLDKKRIQYLIQWANKKGCIVTVDPKFSQFYDYADCHLFKPNLRELNEALGLQLEGNQHDAIREAVIQLRERLPHTLSMITLGKHGMLTVDESQAMHHIAAKLREVVDVSGAGDTTIAVATLALAAGGSLTEAAELANLGAGLVCDIAGVAPATSAMLIEAV